MNFGALKYEIRKFVPSQPNRCLTYGGIVGSVLSSLASCVLSRGYFHSGFCEGFSPRGHLAPPALAGSPRGLPFLRIHSQKMGIEVDCSKNQENQ
jgi:hypothetical protein